MKKTTSSHSITDDYEQIVASFQRMIPALVLMNERVAKKLDLLAVDMQVLHIIALEAHRITPSAIVATSELPPSTVTRILDRLETRGFIQRVVDKADQRKIQIEKIPDAIALVRAEFDMFAEDMRAHTARFSARSQAAIAEFMHGLVALM